MSSSLFLESSQTWLGKSQDLTQVGLPVYRWQCIWSCPSALGLSVGPWPGQGLLRSCVVQGKL